MNRREALMAVAGLAAAPAWPQDGAVEFRPAYRWDEAAAEWRQIAWQEARPGELLLVLILGQGRLTAWGVEVDEKGAHKVNGVNALHGEALDLTPKPGQFWLVKGTPKETPS